MNVQISSCLDQIQSSGYGALGGQLEPLLAGHHRRFRRQGIGTEAIKFAFKKAKEVGKNNIILWFFEKNISSIKFYERCGFVADGASKIYNCGNEMKCLRMRRSLL